MIVNWDEILQAFSKDEPKNLLIANGFNMCLGVDTSYSSLFLSIMKSLHIKEIISDETKKYIEENNSNLEACLEKVSKEHRNTVLTEFYREILDKCKKRIAKYNDLVKFFLLFNKFFTTNYDPLLYGFLLNNKSFTALDIQSQFYKDLKSIHDGEIKEMGPFDDIPLKSREKGDVERLARKMFKKKGIHEKKTREDYFNVLRHIREESTIDIQDGFVINQSKSSKKSTDSRYKVWDNSGNSDQNIFYLHGALNLYQSDEKIKKITLSKGFHRKPFINEVLKIFSHGRNFCVFEKTCDEKRDKIENNHYLKYCLKQLCQAKGKIFIIGWSCSDNDQHLVDAINSSSIDEIYVSFYSNDVVAQFQGNFPNKKLIFIRSLNIPFSVSKSNSREEKNDAEMEQLYQ